ncbi:MAG: flagellar type III secretion system pore protein FliP [Bryobacteraceae bacterium]|nr:flagellar type III secretion system pore protein FliP [Bryobacteraceae bacterium]MDW8380050.1 flagellar type III secretion system pore protein FliP [Bryobacterales bacterium]
MSRGFPLIFLLPIGSMAAGEGSRTPFELFARNGSIPLQVVALITALTLLPAVVMSITPFLRITIVLHFLRTALGTQTSPNNQVLLGLALFLTAIIMQPVAVQMYDKGWRPYESGELSAAEAWEAGLEPLRSFLIRYCHEKDLQLFQGLVKSPAPQNPSQVELRVLLPAYVLSELRVGFQIGAMLFLPFVMIDLLVAGVTLSIGMVQLPPVMLSAPFKVLLFVLADGWNLVVGSLVKSFYSQG